MNKPQSTSDRADGCAINRANKQRCAIVTGGLTGIGLSIAETLAGDGFHVISGSRSAAKATINASTADSPHPPGSIQQTNLDVTDLSSIAAFFEQAESAFGRVDVLINAAGISTSQKVCGHSNEDWEAIIDTNLHGSFRMIRAALPGMMERQWGRIVNIGSTAATVGHEDSAAYCASKAGLLGLTRCVALEGAPRGVTCTMVSPTWVDTPMMRNSMQTLVDRNHHSSVNEAMQAVADLNPQGRIVQADEIASLVAYLCSDAARGLTMENIAVTGAAAW